MHRAAVQAASLLVYEGYCGGFWVQAVISWEQEGHLQLPASDTQ